MPYKEMECPECSEIWKGNVPEPRDKCFFERCQKCGKVVLFKEVQEERFINVEIAKLV